MPAAENHTESEYVFFRGTLAMADFVMNTEGVYGKHIVQTLQAAEKSRRKDWRNNENSFTDKS